MKIIEVNNEDIKRYRTCINLYLITSDAPARAVEWGREKIICGNKRDAKHAGA